jgi:hypothetical protein
MGNITNNIVIASQAQPGVAIHLNSSWIASSSAGCVLLASRIARTEGGGGQP